LKKFDRFEEIDAWTKSRELCSDIYQLTKNNSFDHDEGLRDQLRRAVISIPSNIAEGFERDSRNEFLRFLKIAKGSAGEVRTHLYLAKDLGYVSNDEFQQAVEFTAEISKMISGLIKYLSE